MVLRHVHTSEQYKTNNRKRFIMNWFGIFTSVLILVLITWGLAYGYGYEQAEKDMHMSRQWIMRNHPANGDWK
jgi:quinol-cytochrome oxidoreductase complex cytochrome b subunit